MYIRTCKKVYKHAVELRLVQLCLVYQNHTLWTQNHNRRITSVSVKFVFTCTVSRLITLASSPTFSSTAVTYRHPDTTYYSSDFAQISRFIKLKVLIESVSEGFPTYSCIPMGVGLHESCMKALRSAKTRFTQSHLG